MQESQPQPEIKQEKRRSKKRLWIGLLIGFIVFSALLPLVLYIPAVQNSAVQAVVSFLNDGSKGGMQYKIGNLRIVFPFKLRVTDIEVWQDETCFLHVGKVQTGLSNLPIRQPYFVLGSVTAEDVALHADTLTESLGLSGTIGSLYVKDVEVDPFAYQVHVGQVKIDTPVLDLCMGVAPPDTTTTESSPWNIGVDLFAIEHGALRMLMSDTTLLVALAQRDSLPLYSTFFEYPHMHLTGLDLAAESIHYTPQEIAATLQTLRVTEERCGLTIDDGSVQFAMAGDEITASDIDFSLAGGKSTLRGDVKGSLALLDSVPTGAANATLSITLDSATLARLAAPYLPVLADRWTSEPLSLTVDARYSPDTLHVNDFKVQIPHHVDLQASLHGSQFFNDTLRQGEATIVANLPSADFLLTAFVADPSARSYVLPDGVRLVAEAACRDRRATAHVDLEEDDLTAAEVTASLDMHTEAYHVSALADGFRLDHFMPEQVAKAMTLRAEVDGRSFDFPAHHTRLEATVTLDTLLYQLNGSPSPETLKDVSLTASLLEGRYALAVTSAHPSLQLDTYLEGVLLKDTLSSYGHLNLFKADLAHLPFGLSQADLGKLSFRGKIAAAYDMKDCAHARVCLDTLCYEDEATGKTQYDSLVIAGRTRSGHIGGRIIGGDATVRLSLQRGISGIGGCLDTLLQEVDWQMKRMRPDFAALQQRLPALKAEVTLHKQNPFIHPLEYFTGYTFRELQLHLANQQTLSLNGAIYGFHNLDRSTMFDTVSIAVQPAPALHTPNDSYAYNVHALYLAPKASRSYDVHAAGRLMPDSVTAMFSYVNGNYHTLYNAMLSVCTADDTVTVHLENDPILYEQQFTVNRDNFIALSHYKDYPESHPNTRARVKMEGPCDVKVNLYSRPNPQNPFSNQLLLLVRNLDLGYATQVMEWKGDAGGRCNLTAFACLYPDSIAADVRTGLKDFHVGAYHADTLGSVSHATIVDNCTNAFTSLAVDGKVRLRNRVILNDTLTVRAAIDSLPLPLVNAFIPNNMQFDGFASGGISLVGKEVEHAMLNGHVTLTDAHLNYNDLDLLLSFPSDTLQIRKNHLFISGYKITGAGGNPVEIKGLINMSQHLTDPKIDLAVTGDKARLINNKALRLKNQYIYGRLPISPNIKIKGTPSDLSITGSLRVLSDMDLHYYMQDDPLSSEGRIDQLVEFIDFQQADHQRTLNDGSRPPRQMQQTTSATHIKLKIEIDKTAKVTAHLAGTDKNKVDIVGGGSLLLQNDEQDRMLMNGVYQMNSGKVDYKLPVLPLVKTFNINSTSQVSWANVEAGNPDINITATENVKAAVNNETSSSTQLVNFAVSIHIFGTLDELSLVFDCEALDNAETQMEIAGLDDDSRSKIALMLLISQTYMSPTNSNSMGLGTANAAISSMLNRQIDNIMSGAKGTNIDVGINMYDDVYSGTRTDYSLKVSQQFWHDRMRATIGGKISTGGDFEEQNGAKIDDISLDWLFDKEGTRYMQLFRKTNYESIFEGETTETGISYTQERSGYRFRQLFIPSTQKRQEKIQETIRQLQENEEREEREKERQHDDSLYVYPDADQPKNVVK